MTSPHLIRPITAADCHLALDALRELRPQSPVLTSAQTFAEYLRGNPDYLLVGSFAPEREAAAAVGGYRYLTNLAWGRFLYLDDLSTLNGERGKGHAAALLAWLEEEARRQGCTEFHLDSGTLPTRYTAHRQYLKAGFDITAHHFAKRIT